jgi:hypothetical protein
MSFDYGSKQIEIKNPFSFQGKLTFICGVFLSVLGIVLFFIISARSNDIVSGNGIERSVLFYYFSGAVVLTGVGISMIIKGLFMINEAQNLI